MDEHIGKRSHNQKLFPHNFKEIADRYESGETQLSIAGSFNVSAYAIARVLRASGVKLRGRTGKPRTITPDQEAAIIAKYAEVQTASAIAACFDISIGAVTKVLTRNGITVRSHAETCKLVSEARNREAKILVNSGLCPKCKATVNTGVFCDNCKTKCKRRSGKQKESRCHSGGPEHVIGVSCEHCNSKSRTYNKLLKIKAFEAYGGCRCACCGETELVFLTLDHVNNDGATHRRRLGHTTPYSHLRRMGYPPGFQVLCFNCNFAKQFGPCPHKNSQSGP